MTRTSSLPLHYLIAAALLLLATCSGSTAVDSGATFTDTAENEHIIAIREAVADYYTVTNKARAENPPPGIPFFNECEFIAAKIFSHQGVQYAVVQVIASDVFTCMNCSESEWQAQRKKLTSMLTDIAKMSKQLQYSVDEEKRLVKQTMPRVLYGMLRDDGHWWVYGNRHQLPNDQELADRMKLETKAILGPEYKEL